MKFGLGILVSYLTIYTANSLYADVNNDNNYNESSNVMEQQKKSDLFPKVIDVPEIKINLLPTTTKTTSSILNKLLPHNTPSKDEVSPTLKHASILPSLPPIDNFIFKKQDNADDTSDNVPNAEMIEIEVPFIGNDFTRKTRDRIDMDVEYENGDFDGENDYGYVEIDVMPTSTSIPIAQTTSTENPNEFQTSNFEAVPEIFYENLSPFVAVTDDLSYSNVMYSTDNLDDIHAIESKLMDQYHSSDNSLETTEATTTENLKFKKEEVILEQSTAKPQRLYLHKYPFNVKVIVNNNDEKMSCKNKRSCSQVSYSRDRDIDQEYYKDESDEDLFFNSDSDFHDEKRNQLKSRRAADDGFFNTFNGLSLTPAPRFSGFGGNQFRIMPQIPVVPSLPVKKPSFIERLENESSLEKSERVNKDLNNLMKFIAVWAHVDKFVSDRARSTIKKLAYMTDDDLVDNFALGSRKTVDNNLNNMAQNVDEPFT